MKYICLLLAMLTVGCSTTRGLRETSPTRTEHINGNYEQLANCSLNNFDENSQLSHNLRVNRAKQTARVFVVNPDSFNTVCEFFFVQKGPAVVVESRGMFTLSGRGGWPNYYWPSVMTCSQ